MREKIVWRTEQTEGDLAFAAVFRDVTQRSPERPFGVTLRDIPKDGSEGD